MSESTTPAGWEDRGDRLHQAFEFTDFAEAFAFMTAVAAVAEELDHHPDWSNSYNTVDIELRSHDAGSITDRDRRMAERINELR